MRSIEFENQVARRQVSKLTAISSGGKPRIVTHTQSPFNERGMVVNPGYRMLWPKGPFNAGMSLVVGGAS